MAWATLADTVPLYALYALLFSDAGLSEARISLLFMIWSAVAFAAEIPSGALADRFTRRAALIASSLFQAAGFALWILLPGFVSFAAGFVLWGFGGALSSGAFEALLYEGLVERDAREYYPRVNSAVNTIGLLAQIPSAGLAALLFWLGGYQLVAWVSIGICLLASLLATRLPEPARSTTGEGTGGNRNYLATLRAGISEALTHRYVRAGVIAAAVIGGLDGLEEYFPLLASTWGISTGLVPLAVLWLPLAGAAGAAFGGRATRLGSGKLAATLFAALLILAAAAVLAVPAGLVGVAIFYGLHQMILVVVEVRLQERIEGPARATVTSVASLGMELAAIGLFAAWAWNGLLPVAILWLVLSLALPGWLSQRRDYSALPARD